MTTTKKVFLLEVDVEQNHNLMDTTDAYYADLLNDHISRSISTIRGTSIFSDPKVTPKGD